MKRYEEPSGKLFRESTEIYQMFGTKDSGAGSQEPEAFVRGAQDLGFQGSSHNQALVSKRPWARGTPELPAQHIGNRLAHINS